MEIKLDQPAFECGGTISGRIQWNPVMDADIDSIAVRLRWYTNSGRNRDGAVVDRQSIQDNLGKTPLDQQFNLSVPDNGPITVQNTESAETDNGLLANLTEVYQAGTKGQTKQEQKENMIEAAQKQFGGGKYPIEIHWEILVDITVVDGSDDSFSRQVMVVPKNAT